MPRRSTAAASADINRSSDFDSATTATVTATDMRPSNTQSGFVLYEEHDSEEVTSDWLGHSVRTDTDTDTAMSSGQWARSNHDDDQSDDVSEV